MAEIVFGFGSSHGPLLATPPHEWDLRANVDRKNKALAFGAGTYDFQHLYELRKGEHFENQNTLDVRSERDARCQHQLDVLGERIAKVNPDVLIVVGDDHHEWFLNDKGLVVKEVETDHKFGDVRILLYEYSYY